MYIYNDKKHIIRKLDEKYIIVSKESGNGHLLNNSASVFFDLIVQNNISDQKIAELANKYLVSTTQLYSDIEELINELIKKEIILFLPNEEA